MSIQRYDGDDYDIELEEKEDGIYVMYSDHVAAVDEARRDERRIFWGADQFGYEQGLAAARKAVAALIPDPRLTLRRSAVLAAIDELKEAE
jgi:hypothetical protein